MEGFDRWRVGVTAAILPWVNGSELRAGKEVVTRGAGLFTKYTKEIWHFTHKIKNPELKLTNQRVIMGKGTQYPLGNAEYAGWEKVSGWYTTQDGKTTMEFHYMQTKDSKGKTITKDPKAIIPSTRAVSQSK